MILLKILDHDLHRSRSGKDAVPLIIEVPARKEFLPALVSNARMEFLVSRRLTDDGRIRVGVFSYDSDRLDDVVGPMMRAALDLSVSQKWKNVFDSVEPAFHHVQRNSGLKTQPHVCLVPASWSNPRVSRAFGEGLDPEGARYMKTCRIVRAKIPFIAFCSRPDMVGLYTQFMGGKSSVLLHNVRNGLSFCVAPSRE